MKVKKILALLLAMAMMFAMFSACGSSASSSAAPVSSVEEAPAEAEEASVDAEPPEAAGSADEEAAPADESEGASADGGLITTDYTYELPLFPEGEYSCSMWVSFSDNMSTFMPNGFADNYGYKRAEEITGVHVELDTVSTMQNSEMFNLRVASGDLPNIITNVTQLWTGSYDSAIEDDVFIDLTEMIEDYMPAYKECYDQLSDDVKRELHTDEGNFPRLFSINNYPNGATEGYFIRTDLLEKVGLDIPSTYEELDEVLHAFQSEGLAEPLMAVSGIVHTSNALVSGYGVSGGFSSFPVQADPYYVVDGEAKFGIIEPGFKEYMEMFANYYAEGIISKDFISKNTNPMDFGTTIASGDVGVFPGETAFVPSYIEMGQDINPDFDFAPLPPITKTEGEVTHFGTVKTPISGRVAQIAVSLNRDTDIEKLGKYLDFFFTEEGAKLTFGVEGNDDGSYVIDDNGDLQYSDYWYSLDLSEMEKPTLFHYSVMPNLCPKTPSSYTTDLQFACDPVWNQNADSAYQWPTALSMTVEESEEYAAIYADIRTLIEENLTKFAVGDRSMDEWDSFIDQIYDMGIEDAIAIQQEALNRYYNRSL